MYTTLSACKAELQIDTGDTTDDALLNGYITTAQRIIEAPPPLGTGRVFEAASDTTRYADAPWLRGDLLDPDSSAYVLPLWHIGDLCAITTVVNGDGTTIPSTAYVTEPRYKTPYYVLRLKRAGGYIWTFSDNPEAAIAITGKWAYSTSASADIARATLRLVVAYYRSKDNAGAGDDKPLQTAQGVILPIAIPPDVKAIIASYQSVLG